MQVDGAVQGVSTMPRRKRLNVVLAIVAVVVIGAMVALLVWVVPLATSGVGVGYTRLCHHPRRRGQREPLGLAGGSEDRGCLGGRGPLSVWETVVL